MSKPLRWFQKMQGGGLLNTICSATKERQASAHEVSKDVDLMVVIGGKNSSNSKKLYEICSRIVATPSLSRIALNCQMRY